MDNLLAFLPGDILPNIAKFFKDSPDVYNFALLFADGSEAHRLAAMEALDYEIIFQEKDSFIFYELMNRFGDILRVLSLENAARYRFLFNFPPLPSLRRATVTATDHHLSFLMHSPHLTCLDIKLMRSTKWDVLASTFASLPLTTLTLRTERTKNKPSPTEEMRLAAALPKLEKLDICNRNLNFYKRFWRMIKMLPSLRSLGLSNINRYDEEFRFLQTLDEVRLHSESSVEEVLPLGRNVTKLSLNQVQSWSDIETLSYFPKLRELHIGVTYFQESALIGKAGNVEILDLSWGQPPAAMIYDRDFDKAASEPLYKPDLNFLLRLFRSIPKLRVLSLTNASVHSSLMGEILEVIGYSLESLKIRMDSQIEDAGERLATILNSLALWCPNTGNLILVGPKEGVVTSEQQKQHCLVAIGKTRRKCTYLMTANIISYIYNFVTSF